MLWFFFVFLSDQEFILLMRCYIFHLLIIEPKSVCTAIYIRRNRYEFKLCSNTTFSNLMTNITMFDYFVVTYICITTG